MCRGARMLMVNSGRSANFPAAVATRRDSLLLRCAANRTPQTQSTPRSIAAFLRPVGWSLMLRNKVALRQNSERAVSWGRHCDGGDLLQHCVIRIEPWLLKDGKMQPVILEEGLHAAAILGADFANSGTIPGEGHSKDAVSGTI